MGLIFRKRTRLGRNAWVNWSTGWPSLSVRLGRITWNSKRGLSSVRLGKGFSYRDED
jgi:hypothetical protein